MKRILLSLSLLLALSTTAFAAKARPGRLAVTLTNGELTTVTLRGDEHFNCYVTTDGRLVKRDGNRWRLATEAEKAEATAAQSSANARWKLPQTFPSLYKAFPHTGTPRVLTIMVNFTDVTFTYTKADFDKYLNSTDYDLTGASKYVNYGSVAQYYSDSSNGKFRPVFDIVGPYTLSQSMAYYGSNSGNTTDVKYRDMIREACQLALSGGADFSQYDSDNDGYADLVYVVYAGYGENSFGADPNALWPKSGSHSIGTFSDKQVYRFGISNELYGTAENNPGKLMDGIGVFVHEMGHTLGLPDVYPPNGWTNDEYDSQSMEQWDLMDAGEYNGNSYYPTPLTAWEREWLGWTDAMPQVKDNSTYTLAPLFVGGTGMRVENRNDPSGKEFYILENIPRGASAGWYRYMPAKGMLVTHINYDSSVFSNFNMPNAVKGQPRWTILPANGTLLSSYRAEDDATAKQVRENWAGNVYPSNGVTAIASWREYNPTMTLSLHSITQNADGTITFQTGDGTSGIDRLASLGINATQPIFTLDGRCVGLSLGSLPKGVYITGGRKVVK